MNGINVFVFASRRRRPEWSDLWRVHDEWSFEDPNLEDTPAVVLLSAEEGIYGYSRNAAGTDDYPPRSFLALDYASAVGLQYNSDTGPATQSHDQATPRLADRLVELHRSGHVVGSS